MACDHDLGTWWSGPDPGRLVGLPSSTSWTLVLGLALAIMMVQAVASTWWLNPYRYGPLEWLGRWATWAKRPTSTRSGRS